MYGYKDTVGSINNILNDIKKNFIKLYVPYFWFTLFSTFVFFILGNHVDLKNSLWAFFMGAKHLLGDYCGFQFLWFLPAMFIVMVVRSLWFNGNKIIKLIILLCSSILWLSYITGLINENSIRELVPFAIIQGGKFCIYGILSRWMINSINIVSQNKRRWAIGLFWISFILLISLYLLGVFNIIYLPKFYSRLMLLIMPVLFTNILYYLVDLIKSRFLMIIGKYSLQIYLTHIYIYNLLLLGIKTVGIPLSFGTGLIVLIFTILLSLMISYLLVRIGFIRKILFPKVGS